MTDDFEEHHCGKSADDLDRTARTHEASQYSDGSRMLILRRLDPQCRALEARYEGLKFNQLQLLFLPPSALQDDPLRDDLDILFNLSGSAEQLVRHGFACATWWDRFPSSGTRHNCSTQGFGRVWRVIRTRTGYRLQGARYDDSLSKLAVTLPAVSWPRSGAPRNLSKQTWS